MQLKSYTDIEQSKKLAEILPLESADMLWGYYYNGKNHCIPNIRPFRDGRNEIPKCYTPAWSLAALLAFLPNSAFLERGSVTELYRVTLPVELEASDWYIEPLDACYEMIIRLNKLKML